LQQAIATGTVDFDIIEMGAPFEGDTAGKGLLDEMPDWVKDQIEADDLVGYLQPPVGTWDGKSYRITIDGDCHTFSYRKDYFGEGSDYWARKPAQNMAGSQPNFQRCGRQRRSINRSTSAWIS
jgi:multiple sugar transport system substrate-binding protein